MAEIVKITCGQPFVVYLPLVILNADGSKEAVDASALTDVVVKLQAQGMDDVTVTTDAYERFLVLNIPGTMLVAEYNIIVNATLPNDRPFTLRMSRALGVMAWDWQTNWRDYLVGEHIELCDQPFIAGEFTTDAEYESLKQQLREQIAAAEQAEAEAIAEKERYAEALEHLDDIAKQGDNPNATNTQILYDVNHLVVPPPTGMALESTLTAGITTLQNAITALYGGDLTATLSALKTAIGNIDIDTTDLAKAAKLQDAQDDIDALQVLVGSTSDVSTDSTIFGKLAAVISAISALSIPTVQQIQNGLAKTSELPTGYALETSVKDGNDTAVGVAKDIRSEVGTGSDTAAETGTLFAVVNWIKNTVKSIYNAITDGTNGLAAIKQAVAAIVIPTDYAKETTAQAAATDAAAAKVAAQGITGYALQGSDATATNTAIASLIGYTIQDIDGV